MHIEINVKYFREYIYTRHLSTLEYHIIARKLCKVSTEQN